MNLKNSKYTNIKIIFLTLIFIQISLFILDQILDKKKTQVSLIYHYDKKINMYVKDGELKISIVSYTKQSLKEIIANTFDVNIYKIYHKNNNTFFWNSHINDNQLINLKNIIQVLTKEKLKEFLKTNIEILQNENTKIQEYYENSKFEIDNVRKIVILEVYLNKIENDKDFLIFEHIKFNTYKKKVNIIENIAISFIGSLFVLIFFINRKKKFNFFLKN